MRQQYSVIDPSQSLHLHLMSDICSPQSSHMKGNSCLIGTMISSTQQYSRSYERFKTLMTFCSLLRVCSSWAPSYLFTIHLDHTDHETVLHDNLSIHVRTPSMLAKFKMHLSFIICKCDVFCYNFLFSVLSPLFFLNHVY